MHGRVMDIMTFYFKKDFEGFIRIRDLLPGIFVSCKHVHHKIKDTMIQWRYIHLLFLHALFEAYLLEIFLILSTI